jgi:hypothetical protein
MLNWSDPMETRIDGAICDANVSDERLDVRLSDLAIGCRIASVLPERVGTDCKRQARQR